MKDLHQLARECDDALMQIDWTSKTQEQRRAIIHSALEQARSIGIDEMTQAGIATGSADGESVETLRSCRDHWKAAFHHEREKVIRLSNQIHAIHGKKCICTICELVKAHSAPATATLAAPTEANP